MSSLQHETSQSRDGKGVDEENLNDSRITDFVGLGLYQGGQDHLLSKFEHIFVAAITFPLFLLCGYFYYQLVAYCVCFKMICEMSLQALFLRRYMQKGKGHTKNGTS